MLLNLCVIDSTSNNHWVWQPKSTYHKISAAAYHQLNHNISPNELWPGWRKIWTIKTVTRVKHFLCLIFKGRLSTSDYFYRLHLGPDNPCSLWGLGKETIDHLFIYCPKIQSVWHQLGLKINKHLHFPSGFLLVLGSWIAIIPIILFLL